ncbi:MAG: restriction endonuclease, partial [Bacteroides sp.]|nr:restriction endonuclease [Bacteroides sp.]
IIRYIKSRFFRYIVSIKKKTQDNPRDVFQFVPLQDFSKPWTDKELYGKYELDLFEREYIESLIKPME